MYQVSYILPKDNGVTKVLPAGTYKVTVTGLSQGETVSVQARNVADSGYDTAVTLTKADSGIIGSKSVTINANGKMIATLTGATNPDQVKVRISK